MRLWTTLALLLAVFAMHGLQCAAGANHPGAGPVSAHTAMHPATGQEIVPAAAMPSVGDPVPAAHSGPTDAVAPTTATDAPGPGAGHGGVPHSLAEHLWTLCLAVLAAGLAVLLAVLAARLLRLTLPTATPPWLRGLRWPAPPRPPDLSSLCVLRT